MWHDKSTEEVVIRLKTNTKIGSYERNKRKVELKRINKGKE